MRNCDSVHHFSSIPDARGGTPRGLVDTRTRAPADGYRRRSAMVVKKAAAAAGKVAPGFEGGEPLKLSNSRGLKSALKFFARSAYF